MILRTQGIPMAIKHTFKLFCLSALSLTLFSGCALIPDLPKQDNPLNKDENEKYFATVDMAERFGILQFIQYKGTRLINAMARAGWSVRLYDKDNGIGAQPLNVIFARNRDLRTVTPGARYMVQVLRDKNKYQMNEDGTRTADQRKAYFTLDWYERESNLTNWLDGFNVTIESTLKHQFEELRSLYIDYQYLTRMETRYIYNNKNKLDRSPYYESIYLYPEKYRDIFYKPPVDPKHPKVTSAEEWLPSIKAYGDYEQNIDDRLWYTHCFKMMMLEGNEEEQDKFRKGPISEPFVSEGYYDL